MLSSPSLVNDNNALPYSDGSVESSLLDLFSGRKKKSGIPKDLVNSWSWKAHTKVERENLLNWFPFDSGASVLEVGAGCGALTGVFLKKGLKVTALEPSQARADILRARWKGYDASDGKEELQDKSRKCRGSLEEVVVSGVEDLSCDRKFDYVVVVGVLEYAGRYLKEKDPYQSFLDHCKSHLSVGGTLILAIENRFGLKYFAGAGEDHTWRHFDSIEGYPNAKEIRTFGKKELTSMLYWSGLFSQFFYYPYPDYKFPIEIFSDEYLPSVEHNVRADAFPAYHQTPREYLFDEWRANYGLVKNEMAHLMANSFLIVARTSLFSQRVDSSEKVDIDKLKERVRKARCENNFPVYVRHNTTRKCEYQTITTISPKQAGDEKHSAADSDKVYTKLQRIESRDLVSVKSPVNTHSVEFVKGISQNTKYLPAELQKDTDKTVWDKKGKTLKSKYLRGRTFHSLLEESAYANDVKEVKKVFTEYYNFVSKLSEHRSLDLVMGNIVVSVPDIIERLKNRKIGDTSDHKKYLVFDNEWVSDSPCSHRRLFFRSALNEFVNIPPLRDIIKIRDLLKDFNFTKDEIETLLEQERQWQNKVSKKQKTKKEMKKHFELLNTPHIYGDLLAHYASTTKTVESGDMVQQYREFQGFKKGLLWKTLQFWRKVKRSFRQE